jgi:acyl-CoA synthetase (AMP-forming)/AMP-acid ligase II
MLEFLRGEQAPGTGVHLYESFDDPAVQSLSYRDLPGDVAGYAQYFRDQGIRPRTRVIFPFETSVPVILSFLALIEIGAVPLSVKPLLMATPKGAYQDFLQRIARDYAATRILQVPSLARIELPVTALALPPPGLRGPDAQLRTPAGEELAFVQFSSGSTSFPKGIPVRHEQLRANLAMITRTDGRRPGERVSSWLPLYHDMGLVGGLLSSLVVGVDLLLAGPMTFLSDGVGWWEQLAREEVHGTVIPNFAIDYSLRMLRSLAPERIAELDLSRLRAIYLGSEPINIPNLETFLDLMAPAGLRRNVIMPCYGMAEAVLLVSSRPPGSELRVVPSPSGVPAISLGPVLAEFRVRLRTQDGQLCAEHELGEIELAGGSLAASYFDRTDPLTGDDGFYRTGDLGFLAGGELFVTGRISDRIKVNGQSLFAADFEQAVERLPFVPEGRTAVIQSEGRIVVLTAVNGAAREDPAASRAQIVEQLVRTMGVSVEERDVHYLRAGQLLRTSSGKLQRRAIAEGYQQGTLKGLSPRPGN